MPSTPSEATPAAAPRATRSTRARGPFARSGGAERWPRKSLTPVRPIRSRNSATLAEVDMSGGAEKMILTLNLVIACLVTRYLIAASSRRTRRNITKPYAPMTLAASTNSINTKIRVEREAIN